MRDNNYYQVKPEVFKRQRGSRINAYNIKQSNNSGPDKSKIKKMIKQSMDTLNSYAMMSNRQYFEDVERLKLIFSQNGFQHPRLLKVSNQKILDDLIESVDLLNDDKKVIKSDKSKLDAIYTIFDVQPLYNAIMSQIDVIDSKIQYYQDIYVNELNQEDDFKVKMLRDQKTNMMSDAQFLVKFKAAARNVVVVVDQNVPFVPLENHPPPVEIIQQQEQQQQGVNPEAQRKNRDKFIRGQNVVNNRND